MKQLENRGKAPNPPVFPNIAQGAKLHENLMSSDDTSTLHVEAFEDCRAELRRSGHNLVLLITFEKPFSFYFYMSLM